MIKRLTVFLAVLLFLIVGISAIGQELKSKVIPLTGKLITSDDPANIGTNFRTLQNLRYTESHVKGVGGMTKVNTTSPDSTYFKIRDGFHFAPSQPASSHVLVHAYNTALDAAEILEDTTAIPNAGDFSTTPVVALTSSEPGYFSKAPAGNVIFTNGDESYIWGGSEIPISAFHTSSSPITYTLTNSNDYTDILNNTRQTADQVATLSVNGGVDTYTKLMLHMDGADTSTTFTDSSSGVKAVTVNGNAQIDTAQKKFGTASGLFDGTGDYPEVADSDDWFMGSGPFTIDFWVRFNSYGADTYGFFSQPADPDNYVQMYQDGNTNTLYFAIRTAAANTVSITGSWTPVVDTWYHIAVIRGWGGNTNTLAITVNGTAIGSGNDGDPWPNIATVFYIGMHWDGGGAAWSCLDGWMDEFRVSKGVARWTANFTPQGLAYGNSSNTFLIGSKRPLQGAKFYISAGNNTASTMTVKEWQGSSWTSLTVTDNTDTGATLAQTGTISWTYTGNAKPRYINGLSLYWYQFSFDAGSASIYYVTADAPAQTLRNIWDGSPQLVIKGLKYDTTTYKDYSNEIGDELQSTYADLSSLNTTHALYLGFLEPQQGFDFTFVAGSENGTATVLSVYYWNGSEWTVVTALNDGTISSATSLAKGGTISFQGAEKGTEFRRAISDETPLYYYKLVWSVQLDADVKVAEIRGIPYPDNVAPYTYSAFFQNRTMLLDEKSGNRNQVLYSAENSPDVYNGDDSGIFYVGDDSPITAAATVNLVLTAALEQLIITKKNETYRLFGNGPDNWEIQMISGTVGCVAPKTLKTASLPLDAGSQHVGRHIAIWQGADGIYVTDGKTPSPIHQDIKDVFDKRLSTSINTSKIADSVAFIDNENLEYHWLFASGTSTTLDKEYVFDLKRWKWFEVVRGTGNNLQSGFIVTDTNGNNYNYGTTDAGYMYRLEYGNSFDGGNIVHTMQMGDILFADNPLYETRAQYVNLGMVAKSTTSNSVSYTHYVDTEASSTLTGTMSPSTSGKRISNVVININSRPGVFHSPKFSMTTNNETVGFEPLYMGYFYKVEREHLR